ncbi:hypothetical protein HK101_000206 [Irineochytrium annulatum]|nr:hypothetical protein HK101_000206 [Irineochytrium annulatum]
MLADGNSASAVGMWTYPETLGSTPSPRLGSSLTYVPSKRSCLLFGGASHEQQLSNDLYELNLVTNAWRLVGGATRPPPRYDHLAVLVHRRRGANGAVAASPGAELLLVFGGSSGVGVLDDLWAFDIGTQQ